MQAGDRAGNVSSVTSYQSSVTPPQPQAPEFPLTELHRCGFNKTEGATTADSITAATTTLPGGVTRVPGRTDTKRFLNLDGTAAITAPTTGPRDDQPFTVTALARPSDLTAGGAVVVLGDPSAPLASPCYQASTGKWFATSLVAGENWKGDLDDVRVFSGAARVSELRLAQNSTFHS